jgi:hypothetical protein
VCQSVGAGLQAVAGPRTALQATALQSGGGRATRGAQRAGGTECLVRRVDAADDDDCRRPPPTSAIRVHSQQAKTGRPGPEVRTCVTEGSVRNTEPRFRFDVSTTIERSLMHRFIAARPGNDRATSRRRLPSVHQRPPLCSARARLPRDGAGSRAGVAAVPCAVVDPARPQPPPRALRGSSPRARRRLADSVAAAAG